MRRKLNGTSLNLEVRHDASGWKFTITQIDAHEAATGSAIVMGGFSSEDEAWLEGELKLNQVYEEKNQKKQKNA